MSAISQAVSKMTNVELWNAARKESPTFASHPTKPTKPYITFSINNTLLAHAVFL